MFNVRQRQFLVLLLVIQAQDDAARHIIIDGAGKQSLHLLIYVHAKIKDLFKGRTRKGRALLLFRKLLGE